MQLINRLKILQLLFLWCVIVHILLPVWFFWLFFLFISLSRMRRADKAWLDGKFHWWAEQCENPSTQHPPEGALPHGKPLHWLWRLQTVRGGSSATTKGMLFFQWYKVLRKMKTSNYSDSWFIHSIFRECVVLEDGIFQKIKTESLAHWTFEVVLIL